MKKSAFSLFLLLALFAPRAWAQETVSVEFYTPSVVRIVKGGAAPAHSYAVTASPQAVRVNKSATRGGTMYDSGALKVAVAQDGTVRFFTPKGKLLLREGAWGLETRTEGIDKGAKIVRQTFLPEADEPFYGLGILQDGALSLRGKTRYMIQGNTEDFVPVVQSSGAMASSGTILPRPLSATARTACISSPRWGTWWIITSSGAAAPTA